MARGKILPRWQFPPRFFKKIFVLLLVLLLFLLMIFPIFPYLLVIDGNSNKILYKTSIATDDTFSIKYIHSIHLTPVEEFYRIDKELNLILYELYFDSYGVGMPSDLNEGEVLELKNGKIIIKNMNRSFSNLNLRVGQVISNHALNVDDESIELAKIASPGAYVKIEATRLSILEIMGVL